LAWMTLALILVYSSGEGGLAGFYGVLLLILFLLWQAIVFKWMYARLYKFFCDKGKEQDPVLLMSIFIGLLFSAWVAEVIGVHALFGSFIFGLVMPKDGQLVEDMCHKIELLVVNIFVPLYFAYSGLNTRLSSLNTPALIFAMLLQTFLATVGKVFPVTAMSYFIYKHSGIFSMALGTLINCRGLVSLIAANIGLSSGILNQTTFSMLVLVNVLTTVICPPVFYILYEKYGLDKQLVMEEQNGHEQGTEMTETPSPNTGDQNQTEKDSLRSHEPGPKPDSQQNENQPIGGSTAWSVRPEDQDKPLMVDGKVSKDPSMPEIRIDSNEGTDLHAISTGHARRMSSSGKSSILKTPVGKDW